MVGYNRVSNLQPPNAGSVSYNNTISDLHQYSVAAPMRVLYRMRVSQGSMTSMIHCMLQSHENDSRQLAEDGDILQSD